jgi:REP element-mobilizing transposase RayT
MARGNHGHEIFQDDRDRRCFLETLGEACEKTGWRIHAYVLMGNHYHLLVETPEGNLVSGTKGRSAGPAGRLTKSSASWRGWKVWRTHDRSKMS